MNKPQASAITLPSRKLVSTWSLATLQDCLYYNQQSFQNRWLQVRNPFGWNPSSTALALLISLIILSAFCSKESTMQPILTAATLFRSLSIDISCHSNFPHNSSTLTFFNFLESRRKKIQILKKDQNKPQFFPPCICRYWDCSGGGVEALDCSCCSTWASASKGEILPNSTAMIPGKYRSIVFMLIPTICLTMSSDRSVPL